MSQKGGVSKTTSTINIASCLANEGENVLMIDVDPQCDLTNTFANIATPQGVTNLLFSNQISFSKIDKRLYLLSGDPELEELTLIKGSMKKLIKQISESQSFDYIIFDCKPQKILSSKLTLNEIILIASDYLLIPIDANSSSLRGINDFISSVERISNTSNKNLCTLGIFFANVSPNEIIFKNFYAFGFEQNPDLFFKSYIRKDTKVKQAQALGKSIFSYDKKSNSATDYKNLIKELKNKLV